jgi:hypothetical protein
MTTTARPSKKDKALAALYRWSVREATATSDAMKCYAADAAWRWVEKLIDLGADESELGAVEGAVHREVARRIANRGAGR